MTMGGLHLEKNFGKIGLRAQANSAAENLMRALTKHQNSQSRRNLNAENVPAACRREKEAAAMNYTPLEAEKQN